MLNEVSNRITAKYSEMTKTEKKIADRLLAEKGDLYLTSITEFAGSCGVADSTVFRFCRLLGYSGYNEFKLALAKDEGSARHMLGNEAEEDIYSTITPKDTVAATGNKLRAMYWAAINQTLELLDAEAVIQAADLLEQSDRIYCMGEGGSMVMAMEAWVRFMVVSSKFMAVDNSHLQAITAALMTEKDTIWFFSYSGSTREMEDIFTTAKARGAKIIVVTRFANSPASQYADVVLVCGSNERPLQSGTVVAKIAQLMVIDMVYQEFIRRNSENIEKSREASTKAVSKFLL